MNIDEYFHIVYIIGFTILVILWYAKEKTAQNISKKHSAKEELLAELKENGLYSLLNKILILIFILFSLFVVFTIYYLDNEVNTIINNVR